MKKMKTVSATRIGIIITIVLFTANSCDKHLALKPISTISNASFWTTEDDAQGALAGMYVQLREFSKLNLFLLGEARSETVQSDGLQGDTHQRYYQNLLNANNLAGPRWDGLYTVINTANLILKYAANIDFVTEANKNNVMAQAYSTRAFAYFVLARTWGGVPIKVQPTEGTDPAQLYVPKSSEEEVFALIKADIENALALYGSDAFPEGRHMWSRPATNALKADVHLWTAKRLGGGNEDAQIALDACNAAQTTDVQLLEEYSDIFTYANKGNKEILMAIRFEQFEIDFNYFRDMYMPIYLIIPTLDEESKEIIGVGSIGGGGILLSPSPILRAQYENQDKRRSASIAELFNIVDGEQVYYTSMPLKGVGIVDAGTRYFVDDIILYRLADVILMEAEAKNYLDQDPSDEINTIRQRAFGDDFEAHRFVTGSQTYNDEIILKERLLELCFESKRWWDLVRFDKAFELVPSLSGKAGQKHLLYFPIPLTVLSLEPLVEQIDGYE